MLPISQASSLVFNHKDLITELALHLSDEDILFIFSRVNRLTSLVCSNDYFKQRFVLLHPMLCIEGQDNSRTIDPQFFQELVQFHPSNCWKVACCHFRKASTPINFNVRFFQEEKTVFLKGFEKDKEKAQRRLQEICGSGYEDPNSIIHQAYQAWKCDENNNTLKWGYKRLEAERLKCQNLVCRSENGISLFSGAINKNHPILEEHAKNICLELYRAKKFEKNAEMLSTFPSCFEDRLEFCINLISDVIKDQTNPKDIKRIKKLINLLPCGSEIWRDLFMTCGLNHPHRNDDLWSEHHFPEYLPELVQLLTRYVKDNSTEG